MILRKRFPRRAFTLVELLVAMALISLIMAILSQAFVEGLESFRHLKATGDLQENLRTATIPIRTDLISRHFADSEKPSTLPKRPNGGFLRIEATASTREGADDNGLVSYRASNHALHMTVRRLGSRREDFFSGTLPATAPQALLRSGIADNFGEPNTYLSLEAEASYFLVPQRDPAGQPMYANPVLQGFTPLYALHRRQKLLVKEDLQTAPAAEAASYQDLSWRPSANGGQIEFNRLADVATAANIGRRGLGTRTGTIDVTPPTGTDTLLIPDVLSMTIEVMRGDQYEFVPVVTAFPRNNGIYDTALIPDPVPATSDIPSSQRIKAIKITIRVWDYKTEMSRQVSIIQDV